MSRQSFTKKVRLIFKIYEEMKKNRKGWKTKIGGDRMRFSKHCFCLWLHGVKNGWLLNQRFRVLLEEGGCCWIVGGESGGGGWGDHAAGMEGVFSLSSSSLKRSLLGPDLPPNVVPPRSPPAVPTTRSHWILRPVQEGQTSWNLPTHTHTGRLAGR